MSNLVRHPERSEGSMPSGRSFAALRMTTLFIDQMKIDSAVGAEQSCLGASNECPPPIYRLNLTEGRNPGKGDHHA